MVSWNPNVFHGSSSGSQTRVRGCLGRFEGFHIRGLRSVPVRSMRFQGCFKVGLRGAPRLSRGVSGYLKESPGVF